MRTFKLSCQLSLGKIDLKTIKILVKYYIIVDIIFLILIHTIYMSFSSSNILMAIGNSINNVDLFYTCIFIIYTIYLCT